MQIHQIIRIRPGTRRGPVFVSTNNNGELINLRKLSILKLSKTDRAFRRGSDSGQLEIYLNLDGRNQSIRCAGSGWFKLASFPN